MRGAVCFIAVLCLAFELSSLISIGMTNDGIVVMYLREWKDDMNYHVDELIVSNYSLVCS